VFGVPVHESAIPGVVADAICSSQPGTAQFTRQESATHAVRFIGCFPDERESSSSIEE
jgi:hypothetical protein